MGTDELDRIAGPSQRLPTPAARGVDGIAPASTSAAVGAHDKEGDAGGPGYSGSGGAQHKRTWKVEDIALPDGMLTPQVRKALTEVMEEVDRLRWSLEQSQHRQEYLEGLVDRAAHLPVLNRRAFVRELGKALTRAEGAHLTSALVYLYLETYETIRRDVSLEAAEAALQHVAILVENGIRKTDVAGHVGGAGIAVILSLAKEEVALTKAWEVIRQIQQSPFVFDGRPLKLTLSVGIHEFGEGGDWESAEGALRAADKNQQRKLVNIGEE